MFCCGNWVSKLLHRRYVFLNSKFRFFFFFFDSRCFTDGESFMKIMVFCGSIFVGRIPLLNELARQIVASQGNPDRQIKYKLCLFL